MSRLASKVSPLPESPELTIIGSFGSLLLIINERAVIQVLMYEMFSLSLTEAASLFSKQCQKGVGTKSSSPLGSLSSC